MNSILRIAAGMAALSATAFYAQAYDRSGRGDQALVEIVTAIEKSGYSPIVEISFDDGNWEVEAYEKGLSYELLVDPESGKIIARHRDEADEKPPAGSKRLSEILHVLREAGYTDIHEVSFERQTWEVEARRRGVKRELHVDPRTAEVVSDRADD